MSRATELMKFDQEGLIPAIVQDAASGQVLMMAYMNREALDKTIASGETWFYSRSRQQLWRKGETSGHVQQVKAVFFDCDQDTLLVTVEQAGAACHEGYRSCFYRRLNADGQAEVIATPVFDPQQVYGLEPAATPSRSELRTGESGAAAGELGAEVVTAVYEVIRQRQADRPEGSYTSYLFNQGIDKICKKIGEEAAEVIIAAKNRSRQELTYESADLLYHLLVIWREAGVEPSEIWAELSRRR